MKKILFILVMMLLLFNISFSFAFSDVRQSHWAYSAINTLVNEGVLSGYPDGTFRPEGLVSRAEFSKILVNTFNINKKYDIKEIYEDVPVTHWAYYYVHTASDFIDSNIKNDVYYFYPDEPITRVEVVKAIVKAMGWETKDYAKDTIAIFIDKNLIPNDAREYVAIAYENGIMKGYEDGSFRPNGNIKRAELAKILSSVNTKKIDTISEEKESGEIKPNEEEKTVNQVEIQKPVEVTIPKVVNVSRNIELITTLNGSVLLDGRTYAINNDEKIIAKIENASNNSNFIYYMYSYGNQTEVKKVASDSIEIAVPEDIGARQFRLSVWGISNENNNKSHTTNTYIYTFNATGRNAPTMAEIASLEANNYANQYGLKLDEKNLSFIVTARGELIEDGSTSAIRTMQSIIVRGKPAKNMQEIRYRWDNGEILSITGVTGTITTPINFEKGSKHELTIFVVGKDNTVSKFNRYYFNVEL